MPENLTQGKKILEKYYLGKSTSEIECNDTFFGAVVNPRQ